MGNESCARSEPDFNITSDKNFDFELAPRQIDARFAVERLLSSIKTAIDIEERTA